MKKFLLILLAPLYILNAGQNWKWLNPLPQGNTINDIKAMDSLFVYAAGDNGVFLKTTDGGVNWSVTETHIHENSLYSVFFSDKLNGWACGETGIILHTSDGGLSFYQQASNSEKNLYSITSVNGKLYCTGANGTFLFSDDNGVTWKSKTIDTTTGFSCIKFTSSSIGFITCGNGKILKTTDGGDNWSTVSVPDNKVVINSIFFVDSNIGWACGQNGSILNTTNGGSNWSTVHSSATNWFTSVSFSNTSNGIITGKNGVYLTTSDGGNSWITYQQDSTFSFNSIIMLPNGTGWLAGSSGLINKTTDFGSNWDFQSTGFRDDLNTIKFVNSNVGFILGNNGLLLKTADGGYSWKQINTGMNINLYDITNYYNKPNIYIAGGNGTILTSSDAGETWSSTTYWGITKDDLISIGCSSYFLLAATAHGTCVVKGINVLSEKQIYGTKPGAFGIFDIQIKGTFGYAVGENGNVYYLNLSLIRKENSAPTISLMNNNVAVGDLYDISFRDNYGWAVGKYGILLTSKKSSGLTLPWEKQALDITDARGVCFVDTIMGFVCGSDGTILKTNDGGKSWEFLHSNTTSLLKKIYFVDDQKGFVIGNNGLILKTENGGYESSVSEISDNKNLIPVTSYLKQNFPNPFNPSTSIIFYNSIDQPVSLKVYDILGREIKTLVNEILSKGEHKVDFTPESRSSGVYFYSLKAGNYFETRKMLFVK